LTDVVRLFLDQEIGIFQLPCPELTYAGETRPPRTREEYDTPPYRTHCQGLLGPVTDQLNDYVQNGYEITGLIGIEDSPSCGIFSPQGVFMTTLFDTAGGIQVPLLEVPLDYGNSRQTDQQFLSQLLQLFKNR